MNVNALAAGGGSERPRWAPWGRVAVFGAVCTAAGVLVGAAVVLEGVHGGATGGPVVLAWVLAVAVAAAAAGLEAVRVSGTGLRRAWVGMGVAVGVVYGGVALGAVVLAASASRDLGQAVPEALDERVVAVCERAELPPGEGRE